jgi:hypothetical protein
MKNRPVGAELFHSEEQLDKHDEADGRFPQFCEGAKKKPMTNCNSYLTVKTSVIEYKTRNLESRMAVTCIIGRDV